VPETTHARLVDFFLNYQSVTDFAPDWKQGFRSFALLNGLRKPEGADLEKLIELTCELSDDALDRFGFYDKLIPFLEAVGGLGCAPIPPELLDEASRWIFVAAGRKFESSPRLAQNTAIAHAEKKLCIRREEWLEHVSTWYAVNPWTVTGAKWKDGFVGCSVVLPVTAGCYDGLRSGSLFSHRMTTDQITNKSLYIWLECLELRPRDMGAPKVSDFSQYRSNKFWEQTAMTGQLSRLLDTEALSKRDKDNQILSVLTFGARPKRIKRLAGLGFTEAGTCTPKSGLRVLENELERWSNDKRGAFLRRVVNLVDHPE